MPKGIITKGAFKKGQKPWNTGRHLPNSMKSKIREEQLEEFLNK